MSLVDLEAISGGLTEAEPGFWVGPETVGLHYDSARSLHWREAEDDSGWHRHRAGVVADTVRAFPAGGTVFDVGGGNGYLCRALVEAGVPAVLVEPVDEAVRTAYERGLRPVVCSTVEAADFAPGSLPAVAMFDVLEHVEDDVAQLRCLHDLLVPGGRLYLTAPKHPVLWSAHDDEAGHQRRYTTRSLLEVVGEAGFQVEYHTSFFSALVPAMAARRVLQRRPRPDAPGVSDPTAGGGLLARGIDRLLAHERSSLRRHPRHMGTSILVVARRD